jgi:hypothetical protein
MSSKKITSLEIQALRKFLETVPPEKRAELLKKHPDSRITEVYNYLMLSHQKTPEYRFIHNLQYYTKQCKSVNLKNLSKKELIKCLFKNYPFDEIKKKGGIQYVQFLSFFFNIVIFGYPTYYRGLKDRIITNDYPMDLGTLNSPPVDNTEPYGTGDPWSRHEYVPILPTISSRRESELISRFKTISLQYPRFTMKQFIEIVNVLFPVFMRLYPREWNGLKISVMNKYTLNPEDEDTISTEKLQKFLYYIGKKISQNARLGNPGYTPQEEETYGHNFRFSTSQIEKFLNIFTREQYITILKIINNILKPDLIHTLQTY